MEPAARPPMRLHASYMRTCPRTAYEKAAWWKLTLTGLRIRRACSRTLLLARCRLRRTVWRWRLRLGNRCIGVIIKMRRASPPPTTFCAAYFALVHSEVMRDLVPDRIGHHLLQL